MDQQRCKGLENPQVRQKHRPLAAMALLGDSNGHQRIERSTGKKTRTAKS